LSSRGAHKTYTSGGGGGFLSICSCVVRGENSATRKAIPNRASNPNKTIVHTPVLSVPVTGITPGVTTTTTVGGTTVIAGTVAVAWNFITGGAAGDPKALKNRAVRIITENNIDFSFIGTPFGVLEFRIEIFSFMFSITRVIMKCYSLTYHPLMQTSA